MAARLGCTTRIGRAHVGREKAKNIAQGHFVLVNLVLPLFARYEAEILVAPGMGGDLVALRVHTFYDVYPWVGRVVYLALADVVARNEEGCFRIHRLENV